MLAKKLTTLAGTAGILAIGACFLPPPPPPQLPPPPLPRRDLGNIHHVRVVVEDRSPTRHLDPQTAANAIAEGVNLRSRNSKVKASAYQETQHADAVLNLIILSQRGTATPSGRRSGLEDWYIHIDYSATLTKPGGQVLWQDDHLNKSFSRSLRAERYDLPWTEPGVQYSMMNDLGSDLALRMFYVH